MKYPLQKDILAETSVNKLLAHREWALPSESLSYQKKQEIIAAV